MTVLSTLMCTFTRMLLNATYKSIPSRGRLSLVRGCKALPICIYRAINDSLNMFDYYASPVAQVTGICLLKNVCFLTPFITTALFYLGLT